MNEKKWFCLYTKAGCEKRVAESLKKKGIDTYFPSTHTHLGTRPGDKRKSASVPLFRTYVFAQVADENIRTVNRTPGVLSVVHWLGTPVTVKDNEIQLMKMFIAEHTRVQVERTRINSNEMVRIVTDSSMEFSTNAAFAFTNPVKIIFPSLGYAIIAETPVTKLTTFTNKDMVKGTNQYQLVAP